MTNLLHRLTNDVVRVRAADALREDVVDARALDDGANCTAGDDDGTSGGRLEEDPARGELAADFVRHRLPVERDAEDVLARLVIALADRFGDLVGPATTDANVARRVYD